MSMTDGYRCRECGITEIEPGTEVDGQPLCWQDEDFCSRCHDRLDEQLVQDAARYRHIRNRQFRAVDIAAGGVFAWIIHANLIIGGEDLDRAVDFEMGVIIPTIEPLERRLARCLAECIDTPLLTGKDEPGAFKTPLDLRLGFFRPELSERAADLLEEAGV